MATATEKVHDVLLGVNEEEPLSAQARATFMRFSKQDPNTGERYLGEQEFIDAVAPENEDYVS
jgi:solute carrier family 25 (mitochondrial aspartate/glutamate transporter), member 12/13